MHLEIEMGKLERHQYALNIMRKRIKMLMAGDEDYWAKLERLLKTSNTHKVCVSFCSAVYRHASGTQAESARQAAQPHAGLSIAQKGGDGDRQVYTEYR